MHNIDWQTLCTLISFGLPEWPLGRILKVNREIRPISNPFYQKPNPLWLKIPFVRRFTTRRWTCSNQNVKFVGSRVLQFIADNFVRVLLSLSEIGRFSAGCLFWPKARVADTLALDHLPVWWCKASYNSWLIQISWMVKISLVGMDCHWWRRCKLWL